MTEIPPSLPSSPPGSTPPSEQRETDYEIQFRTLVLLGVGTVVLVVASAFGVYLLYQQLARWQAAAEAPPPVMEEARAPVMIHGPRLQALPEQDLARLREQEEVALGSYGWADEAAGVARIPIERAIDLLLARGLPVEALEEAPAGATEGYLAEAGSPPPARLDATAAAEHMPPTGPGAPIPVPDPEPDAGRDAGASEEAGDG
jgi:hypothetical protein